MHWAESFAEPDGESGTCTYLLSAGPFFFNMVDMTTPLKTRISCLTIFMLCLVLCGCLKSEQPVIKGVLHGDLVWSGTVHVAGDVILDEDVRLTILPGTMVRFLPPEAGPGGLVEHPHFPGSELIVKGRVRAIGSSAEPIVFESADPQAAAGDWGAINLEGSEEAIFEYCIFRQADSAVHSRDSQVYIEHSVFENNLVGVRFHDSDILIERNLLRNNQTAIRFHFGSPVICENILENNAVNLFVTSYPRDYHIENNSFGFAREYQVVLGEQVPDDVLLPRNYWQHQAGSFPENAFYDGRHTEYLGKVIVDPVRTSPSKQAGPAWSP